MKAAGSVYCGDCGRLVGGYVPRGGDGSGLHAFRHSKSSTPKDWCPGSYRLGHLVQPFAASSAATPGADDPS